jgi:hypothetical protein
MIRAAEKFWSLFSLSSRKNLLARAASQHTDEDVHGFKQAIINKASRL